MASSISLDHAGILEVLKSTEVAKAIHGLAAEVAASAESDPAVTARSVDVEVQHYVTDRTAASVTLKHPGGLGIEAKHGVLTRAAGDHGLEVRSKK